MARPEGDGEAPFVDVTPVGNDQYMCHDKYGLKWVITCSCHAEQDSQKRCAHCGERMYYDSPDDCTQCPVTFHFIHQDCLQWTRSGQNRVILPIAD